MKTYLFLVAVFVFFLLSCKQVNKKEEVKVLAVGAMSSMDFVPLAVAKRMKFFEKHGVEVKIEKFYSANDRDAAFHGNLVDGTVIDYTGAILQKVGGIDLRLTSACDAPFAIVSSPSSQLRIIDDLKGKKIAVSRNTVIDFCMDMALQSVNLTEKDVEKVEINKIPIRFEMLMKGEIDATALPDPFITMAKSKNCKVISDMNQLGYQVTGFVFSKRAIDTKNKEIHAFYKAYNEAVDYIKTHTVEDLKEVLTQDIGFPEALISQVQLPNYFPASLPLEKDLQKTTDWLKSKQLVPDTFVVSEVLDNQFVK